MVTKKKLGDDGIGVNIQMRACIQTELYACNIHICTYMHDGGVVTLTKKERNKEKTVTEFEIRRYRFISKSLSEVQALYSQSSEGCT